MRRLYGAPWYHLVLHAALFGAIAWVVGKAHDIRATGNVLAWFVGGLVLHDLVFVPLYSVLDAAARRPRLRVPVVNHLRVPAILGALLFLAFPGLILGRSDGNLHFVSGVTPSGYLLRWALICAALFAGSGLVWLLRVKQLQHAPDPAGDEHATA
jgi:hypothetical protein